MPSPVGTRSPKVGWYQRGLPFSVEKGKGQNGDGFGEEEGLEGEEGEEIAVGL